MAAFPPPSALVLVLPQLHVELLELAFDASPDLGHRHQLGQIQVMLSSAPRASAHPAALWFKNRPGQRALDTGEKEHETIGTHHGGK